MKAEMSRGNGGGAPYAINLFLKMPFMSFRKAREEKAARPGKSEFNWICLLYIKIVLKYFLCLFIKPYNVDMYVMYLYGSVYECKRIHNGKTHVENEFFISNHPFNPGFTL